jgi:hypothetical protein
MRTKRIALNVCFLGALVGIGLGVAQAIETTRVYTGVLHHDEQNASDGYTLLQTTPVVRLINNEGRVVHQWDAVPGGDAQLTPQGTLLRASRGVSPDPDNPNPLLVGNQFWGGTQGRLREWDWDGNLVWDINLADTDWVSHHTFHRTQSGTTFVLIWDRHSRKEAIRKGRHPATVNPEGTLGTDPRPGVYIGDFWPDKIIEIAYIGPTSYEVVWEWRGWDHLCNGRSKPESCLDINYHVPLPTDETHRSSADYMHVNAVDFLEEENLVLLTSRIFGEFYLIDYDSGEIKYRWGNPSAWDKKAEPPSYMNDGDTQLFGPHGANFIDYDPVNKTVNVLLFDNGWLRPSGNFSRAVEVEVNLNDPDYYAEPIWTYQTASANSLNSPFVSYAQRLRNENMAETTLITSGMENHIFEVTQEGAVVWEYVIPYIINGDPQCLNVDGAAGDFVFRAYRYAPEHPGLVDKQLNEYGEYFPDCQ